MSRRARVVAVTLPLLAIALGIARAELFLRDAQEFVFEIEGYDPRDPLRGYYLQFRLHVEQAAARDACDEDEDDCCLCLTRTGAGTVPIAARGFCAPASADCDGLLAARYVDEPMRYYVPEEHARAFEERLIDAVRRRQAHVLLAVDAHGNARVRELRIDGKPLAP